MTPKIKKNLLKQLAEFFRYKNYEELVKISEKIAPQCIVKNGCQLIPEDIEKIIDNSVYGENFIVSEKILIPTTSDNEIVATAYLRLQGIVTLDEAAACLFKKTHPNAYFLIGHSDYPFFTCFRV